MSLKALVFDLDGVLTDTAKYHYLAWKKLADELGFYFDEDINELLKGVSRINSFEIILEKNNATTNFSATEKEVLANKKNEYYKEMIEQLTPNDILPGIVPFITEARNNGVKCAVASISKNASRVLELLEISDMFDYIADAALVKKPKPDPEIFLTCANALGFDPAECIGVEDAQAGIESIHAAGMLSVGINVTVTSIMPDIVLKSTSELDFNKIKNQL
ncbi:MAG: beta-phosphoglucomutase [Clostridia bacterium]|nr:beta-phosphoglucomutase [Clostridia bacterium]